MPSIFTVHCGP